MMWRITPPWTCHRRALLAAAALALAACGGTEPASAGPAPPEPNELIVLAASSLTDAFTALGEAFPLQPGNSGVKVFFSFGASSQLRTQLVQGAPADLFASADMAQMEQAIEAGVIQGTPQVFARNRLVVIVPQANPAGITSLADLAKPGLKLVTTPQAVPVGAYTRQALAKMAAAPQYGAGFDERVLANVVSEEANVRQVVAKVQLGEADAGIVYASDVTANVAPHVKTLDIPDQFNSLAAYPIAVTKQARAPATARRFIEYVRSPAGQAIMKRHGFVSV
ncbi:MAG: molybdate ABC transporter substrate-binding protein [Chloroflexota bacterium]